MTNEEIDILTKKAEMRKLRKEAAEYIGLSRTHLTLCLNGTRNNNTKLKYYEKEFE
jgi:hypothetical protein